jgi:hypothetical protein
MPIRGKQLEEDLSVALLARRMGRAARALGALERNEKIGPQEVAALEDARQYLERLASAAEDIAGGAFSVSATSFLTSVEAVRQALSEDALIDVAQILRAWSQACGGARQFAEGAQSGTRPELDGPMNGLKTLREACLQRTLAPQPSPIQ